MAQSRHLIPQYAGIKLGNSTLTEDAIDDGLGDVVGPASAVANAVCRYDGTTGKAVKSSIVTLSDAGTLASTGALGLTATTGLTLAGTSVNFPRATVTQDTSATTGVTVNAASGQITTVALTTAADATDSFTVTNSAVSAASTVVCTLAYGGTLGTQGVPVVTVNNVASGSFVVNITNVHATNALAATCKVHFIVV